MARAGGAGGAPAEKFELRDGDRVAFIGNTFFEREQGHSYLETLLVSRFPDRNVTFRNLAWSGDTVFGQARAAFDTPEQGFERLIKVTREVKPTVMFISYGMGESFEGEAGLSNFRQGLARLLDRLGELKARTVLVSPIRHEDLGPPFPTPDAHDRDLRRYIEVLKQAADKRGYTGLSICTSCSAMERSRARPTPSPTTVSTSPPTATGGRRRRSRRGWASGRGAGRLRSTRPRERHRARVLMQRRRATEARLP